MSVRLDPQTDGNVSVAWLRAAQEVHRAPGHEVGGLIVEVSSGDGQLHESPPIREALDKNLREVAEAKSGRARQPTLVATVASTIFPLSMWNQENPRGQLFDRYRGILATIQRDPRNKDGTYFSRFLEHGQLEHVLATRLDKDNHRRSAYQLVVFDPSRDHGDWKQKGFPCLHQVSFVPDPEDGTLAVFGYYPTQTMFEKAYGNYVGLWNLGRFVAHEWGLRMASVTCVTVVAKSTNGKNDKRAGELITSLKGLL